MREHSKKKTIEDAVRLGRFITTYDRGNLSLEMCIETTVAEVVRRARYETMMELVEEFTAAGRMNAARWLLLKVQSEMDEQDAERKADLAYCALMDVGTKGQC